MTTKLAERDDAAVSEDGATAPRRRAAATPGGHAPDGEGRRVPDASGGAAASGSVSSPAPAPSSSGGAGERGRASGSSSAPITASPPDTASGFLRRHRVALVLAVVALSFYVGTIVYILYGRGPVA